ncbi:MAG: hypothetical protein V4674_03275 [Patescibacteria group bacterium]
MSELENQFGSTGPDSAVLITPPRADSHVHFREAEAEQVWNVRMVGRDTDTAVPILNLSRWIKTGAEAVEYRDNLRRIADREGRDLDFVMSIMLAEDTTPAMIVEAKKLGVVEMKCMFDGLSTNSRAQQAIMPDRLFEKIETLRAIAGEGMIFAPHLEVKCLHGKKIRRWEREREAEPLVHELLEQVPGIKIAVKHVSTAKLARALVRLRGAVGIELTPQHYETSVDDMIDDKLNLANVFLPVPQDPEEDQAYLRELAVAGYDFVWLGTDQAVHPWAARKAKPLAACGAVSAHVAGPTAIKMFEQSGHSDWVSRLVRFWRRNFLAFYGVERKATRTLRWVKRSWTVPDWYEIEGLDDKVLPLLWGKTLDWQLEEGS